MTVITHYSSQQKEKYQQQIGTAIEQVTDTAVRLADPLTVVALILEGAISPIEVTGEMFNLMREQIPALRQSYLHLVTQLEMLASLTHFGNISTSQTIEPVIDAAAEDLTVVVAVAMLGPKPVVVSSTTDAA